MEKNVLKHTGLLVFVVVVTLLLIHLLPGITIGGHVMRRVDILGDVRNVPEPIIEPDSLLPPLPKVKPAFVDTCRTGMTCIEDYSDSTLRGMTKFYRAIDELKEKPRPVRIAYFGDSFIEADILTADLREMLQKKYGGCGVGFVTITSMTSGYRPTVRHSFGGWQSHSIMDSVFFDRSKQGVSGHYFISHAGAYVELKGQKSYASRLDTCQRASIFFYNRGEAVLTVRVNREETVTETFEPINDLQQMTVEGHIGSVRWTVERADSTLFYGLALDGTSGIALDNFSLRGTSGLSLRSVPVWMMRKFNEQRPYDLIVLQYGLNVATERGRNYDKYIAGMRTTLQHLKEAFPQAAILVVSVGDRDYKTEDGDLRTMPGIKNLVRYQQNLAADEAVAFWNMFEAMGGDGSMAGMVHAKPSLANYDYTHINFRGGKYLAELLYKALIYGKEQYDKRRAYEEAEP
ncbi:SGNH/GDSL hydrolase family protein [Bacteroides helcogenes]|uniref:Periplasmic protein n=1 Tax=Bacteroides helcogenes (strain ATCC 35417 / DSM 20613 / JCM 6297 / CCUG 15421 / P 36-108) TaxID=693979 RepID=E6SS08_BACT6|nr:SGNH/GDSL hydrolase family protein [Bacteroides helcogenes]ADV43110.1 putative periplasmic protein [Bacteroides helcogenes P 36-108]MDY5237904.1 SGNH/GDSL hydrolase family protein [Bacteroides helcogenes]